MPGQLKVIVLGKTKVMKYKELSLTSYPDATMGVFRKK